jgi:hypothetical protein
MPFNGDLAQMVVIIRIDRIIQFFSSGFPDRVGNDVIVDL